MREVVWDPSGDWVCVAFEAPRHAPRAVQGLVHVVAVYAAMGSSLTFRTFLRGPPGAVRPHKLTFSPCHAPGALLSAVFDGPGGAAVIKSWPLQYHVT